MDKQKALVVDDSDSMRYVVAHYLEEAGYEVSQATNGIEGLNLANEEHFDVIITDINMPVMNGYDFIQETRKTLKNKHSPILTLTLKSSSDDKEKGRKAGATGWLVKPFNDKTLLNVIRKFSV